jgi:hypothetical protein
LFRDKCLCLLLLGRIASSATMVSMRIKGKQW